jgi:hypothetical protein
MLDERKLDDLKRAIHTTAVALEADGHSVELIGAALIGYGALMLRHHDPARALRVVEEARTTLLGAPKGATVQ